MLQDLCENDCVLALKLLYNLQNGQLARQSVANTGQTDHDLIRGGAVDMDFERDDAGTDKFDTLIEAIAE